MDLIIKYNSKKYDKSLLKDISTNKKIINNKTYYIINATQIITKEC